MNNKIIIAVPRGRIIEECKKILNKTSFAPDPVLFDENSRKLTFASENRNIFFIKVRAFDVCTFVAFGAAHLGVSGNDVVEEYEYSEVYSPLDLNIGHCRLSVAAPKKFIINEEPSTWSNIRVATKYPNLTKRFFAKRGVQVDAIKLNGSMELAPSLSMCRRIVDLVSSGKTLKENGLEEIEKILDVQSKLIVNRSAYKTRSKKIESIISEINNIIS